MYEESWICDDRPSSRFPIFTRGNVGETFAEPVSPLTWDLLGFPGYELGWRDALLRIGAFTADEFRPGENEACGCFCGYIYINVSVSRVLAVRTPGMTPELMDRSFFGEQKAPPYLADPRDASDERTEAIVQWLNDIFVAAPGAFPDPQTDRAEVSQLKASRPDLSRATDSALFAHAQAMAGHMRKYFGRHIYFLYAANFIAGTVTAQCASAGRPDAAASILSQLGDVDSAGPSVAIWKLSRLVRDSAVLSAAFDADSASVIDALSRAPTSSDIGAFRAAWRDFLEEHGSYGKNMWELRAETFETHPYLALGLVDCARLAADQSSADARQTRIIGDRQERLKEVLELLEGEPARGQLRAAASAAAVILPLRERAKTNCVRLLQEIRLPLRELGRRLVARGWIDQIEDVFLLRASELVSSDLPREQIRSVLPSRRAGLGKLKRIEPQFVFDGAPPNISTLPTRTASTPAGRGGAVSLTGIGAAPGKHSGPARVIHTIDDAGDVQSGDVLIAPVTDASWGPLFLTAGAVVVEKGAVVSHAAILARELGIPCVVSVPNATQRVHNGAIVSVDGGAGTVLIESPEGIPHHAGA